MSLPFPFQALNLIISSPTPIYLPQALASFVMYLRSGQKCF